MNNISDKALRKAIAERFLDCDTTVDEERQLALFYNMCIQNDCIPEGEEDVCRLVTATVKTYKDAKPAKPTRRLRPWHWLSAACIAGLVAAGLFFAFAGEDKDARLLAASDTAHVQQGTAPALAAPKNMPDVPDAGTTPQPDNEATAVKPIATAAVRPSASTAATSTQRDATAQPTARNKRTTATDVSSICQMAIATFHNATDIAIERKGDAMLISTADGEGTCCRYIVHETDGGHITIIEI